MRFLSLPCLAAFVFSSFAIVACAGSDQVQYEHVPAPGTTTGASPTDPAVTDAASFCAAMCGRVEACDMSLDTQTCKNQCTNADAAVFPRLRTDVVGLIVSCFDSKDCKTVLGGEFVGACTADAIASVAPSAAASAFCDALVSAKKTCNSTTTKATCLESAKLYGDDAIAQAQNCVARSCGEIDACVSAVFGSLGGSTAVTTGGSGSGGNSTGSSCTSGSFSGLGSCETCAETQCCAETTTCYATASCQNILEQCVNGTATTNCSTAYSQAPAAAQQLASAVLTCASSKCSSGSATCHFGGG